jgi:hypothetical protein
VDDKEKQLYAEENLATFKGIRQDLTKLIEVFSEKVSVEVSVPETQSVKGSVTVDNPTESVSINNIDLIKDWLESLGDKLELLKVEQPEQIKELIVSNIAEAKSDKVAISNLTDLKQYFTDLEESIKQNKPIVNVQKQFLELPTSASKPIAVRLSDGKSFYNSIAAAVCGGRTTPYQDSSGNPQNVTLVGGAVPVSASFADNSFQVNDIEEAATSYFGYTRTNGEYMIKRLTTTALTYATITNNPLVLTYSDAWTNRATLTYQRYDEAF